MTDLENEKYFIRESFYNLVELSLLARLYEEHCVPAGLGSLNQQSLAQTLLKMKASEGNGRIVVAVFETDPVAFYWQYEGTDMALWIHKDHKGQSLEDKLVRSIRDDIE